ncbi:hypothetical protein Glove_141g12 [Diversispora epigaea]|uniref:Uncharacterized protein n=1 Tax=Diversispora epigaea TaxID=1348612 RepID=A0A397IYT4_9GLOM|nr:hypothetical protein Glove_141g12 [Diversispora epigaea]
MRPYVKSQPHTPTGLPNIKQYCEQQLKESSMGDESGGRSEGGDIGEGEGRGGDGDKGHSKKMVRIQYMINSGNSRYNQNRSSRSVSNSRGAGGRCGGSSNLDAFNSCGDDSSVTSWAIGWKNGFSIPFWNSNSSAFFSCY